MGETSGLSCVEVGSGPPLVVLSFLPEAGEPAGLTWRYMRRVLRPFAERFTVHVPNRRPGLPAATTMGEMAAHYADGVRRMGWGGCFAYRVAISWPGMRHSWNHPVSKAPIEEVSCVWPCTPG